MEPPGRTNSDISDGSFRTAECRSSDGLKINNSLIASNFDIGHSAFEILRFPHFVIRNSLFDILRFGKSRR